MAPIRHPRSDQSGYTLIEVLVVLAIVAILAIAGATALGNRGGNSVRVVLDELEGAIMDAHKYASSSGRDVAVVTWGPYNVTGTVPTMYMARGVISPAQDAAAIQTTVTAPPPAPTPDQQSVSAVFMPTRSREYMNVGVVVNGSNWWVNAMQANSSGKKNADISTTAPFNVDAGFIAANVPANNLFQNVLNQVSISGANKRFNNSFIIQVVSTSTGGFAIAGGAMGLIVVLNNGATVYKFYNSGVNNGDGQWRRI